MALMVHSSDLKVELDGEAKKKFEKSKKSLEDLTEKSRVFLTDDAKEVVVGKTPFARPTWITLGTDVNSIKSKATSLDTHIVIIGSGGSLEPALAIYGSLIEPHNTLYSKVRVIPVNSTNPNDPGIRDIGKENLPSHCTHVYAISKSGNTLNLIFNMLRFYRSGHKVTAITENNPNSILKQIVDKTKIEFVEHTDVGGRFTANQPNTLLPMYSAASYINREYSIDEFVAGINMMAQKVRPDVPLSRNPAKQMALAFYKAELAGYNVIYMPVYSKGLMGIANIATQLVHETYGKNGKGQIILAVEAPECHHHSNQIFFGGQKNMVGLTVGVRKCDTDYYVDASGFEDIKVKELGTLRDLNGLSYTDFMHYERMGLYQTAVHDHIPIMDICLEREDGYNVGSFMGLMQGFVMYSAFLRGSRWEDQPAVEESKITTTQMGFHRESIKSFLDKAERL